MNPTPDPLAVAETVLAPLRMLYDDGHYLDAIYVPNHEAFDAVVQLPAMVRELRAELEALHSKDRVRTAEYNIVVSEVRELREALRRLAFHSVACEHAQGKCTCGLDAALEGSGG